MDMIVLLKNLVNSVFFSFIGLAIFAVGYYVFDKVTPGNFWKEILEDNNTALAILVGSVVLGISMIIASSIHG